MPRLSLVVSTANRTTELSRLMDSLLAQDFKDFEVLVVDQNHDDRVFPVLEGYRSKLAVKRVHTPGRHGVSAGRNDGWRQARGQVIVFPDDDCWYPPWFLRKGLELLDRTGAELVSGRSADEEGRTINGRFSRHARRITSWSVWTTQAEWVTFHRRELLERVGGFDENLGIGSPVPWQAAEGPDLILTALQRGSICHYDPTLHGFHRKYNLADPTDGLQIKGRIYARGMGHVLRRHKFGMLLFMYWALRPLFTVMLSLGAGRFHRAADSLAVLVGRIEGYTARLWPIGKLSALDRIYRPSARRWRRFAENHTPGALYGESAPEKPGPKTLV